MNRRVDEREWIQYQWDYLVALLGGSRRIEHLAYETGAFSRRRKVECPTDLLRLILTRRVPASQQVSLYRAEPRLRTRETPEQSWRAQIGEV